jgi:hypothetical protein
MAALMIDHFGTPTIALAGSRFVRAVGRHHHWDPGVSDGASASRLLRSHVRGIMRLIANNWVSLTKGSWHYGVRRTSTIGLIKLDIRSP